MTVRTEDVVGGIVAAVDAIRPEPGEFLVLRLKENPAPESALVLQEWLKSNLPENTAALVAVPGAEVTSETIEQLGFQLWGSECLSCGNATHASQRCELCGSTRNTRTLWMKP